MFYKEHIVKKAKPFSKISIFSTVIVIIILFSGINIGKSFAIEKETTSLLNPTNSKIKDQIDKFTSCVLNTIKNGDSSNLPKFFKDEPTKTDMAICYKEITDKQL